MKYEEPILKVSAPISVLKRIEECLFRDVGLAYEMRGRGHRINRHALRDTEYGLEIISEVITKHEASLIIGESLSDKKLETEFPTVTKKGKRKK